MRPASPASAAACTPQGPMPVAIVTGAPSVPPPRLRRSTTVPAWLLATTTSRSESPSKSAHAALSGPSPAAYETAGANPPAPSMPANAGFCASRSTAVATIACRTLLARAASAGHSGWRQRIRAAVPATIGADMLVLSQVA
jgi:hypothetical protein